MNQHTAHTNLKNDIMLTLQKYFGDRIILNSRSVGLVYYKRGNRFEGPFKMGNKGDSDIYGSLSFKTNIALTFNIEVKSGKGELSKDQKKRQKIGENKEIACFVGRNKNQVLLDFQAWEDVIYRILRGEL